MSVLERLAGALPERVWAQDGDSRFDSRFLEVFLDGQWHRLANLEYPEDFTGRAHYFRQLEGALREEIEARGLYYSQHSTPQDGSGTGRVYVAEVGPHSAHGACSALALAAALLAALEAPAGAGA